MFLLSAPLPSLIALTNLRSKTALTLAAKSIVRNKTIESGSIVLVIDPALERGGEGERVIGRGVRDPLATDGSSRCVIIVYLVWYGMVYKVTRLDRTKIMTEG